MGVAARRRGVGAVLSAAMVGGAVVGGSALSHNESSVASWVPAAVTIPLVDIDQTLGPLTLVRMLESVLESAGDEASARLNGRGHTQWADWWEASGELTSWLRARLDTAAGIVGEMEANGWSSDGAAALQLGQLGWLATQVQGLRLTQVLLGAGLSPQQASAFLDGVILDLDDLGISAPLAQAGRAMADVSAVLGELTADGRVSHDQIRTVLDLFMATGSATGLVDLPALAQGNAALQGQLGRLTSRFIAGPQEVWAFLSGDAAVFSANGQGSLTDVGQGSTEVNGTLAQLTRGELNASLGSLSALLNGVGARFAAGTQGVLRDSGQGSADLQGQLARLMAQLNASSDRLSAKLDGGAAESTVNLQGSLFGVGQGSAGGQGQLAQLISDLEVSSSSLSALLNVMGALFSGGTQGSLTGVGQGATGGQGQLVQLIGDLDVSPDSLSALLNGAGGLLAAGMQSYLDGVGQVAAGGQGLLAQFSDQVNTSPQGVDAVLSGVGLSGSGSGSGELAGLGQGFAQLDGQLAEAVTTFTVTPTRVEGGVAVNAAQFATVASVGSADGDRRLDVEATSRAQGYGQVCAGSPCAGGLFADAGFDLSASSAATLTLPDTGPVEVRVNAPNHLAGQWTTNGVRLTGELGATVQVGSVTVGRIVPIDIHIPNQIPITSTLQRTASASTPAPAGATAPAARAALTADRTPAQPTTSRGISARAVPRPAAHPGSRHHSDAGPGPRDRTDRD